MRKIEMREGRWFSYTNHHGEKIIVEANQNQDADDYVQANGLNSVSILEGTGVRVVDEDCNVVEDWVISARRERAIELAGHLLDRYKDQ